MNKRLKEISSILSEFSLGNFDKKISISGKLDELDAVAGGINMLGDELKSITISKNYFTRIFDSVSDMVFILNTRGVIEDLNKPCEHQLNYTRDFLTGQNISILFKHAKSFPGRIIRALKTHNFFSQEKVITTFDNKDIPVRIRCSFFTDERRNRFVLFTATNITSQIKTENLIIRAIINTQEKERQRLAKDLHDGLIQQLTAIKFIISSMAHLVNGHKHRSLLDQSNGDLSNAIMEVRNICFNLMPKSLEEFSLIKAIESFCEKISSQHHIHFQIRQSKNFPELKDELKIDLYRITQEFINNSIIHGHADEVQLSFSYNKRILRCRLSDNGVGFNERIQSTGMGLQNAKSRVKSHSGDIQIKSIINKGTYYRIAIPLNR